jgi:hypothetical protein
LFAVPERQLLHDEAIIPVGNERPIELAIRHAVDFFPHAVRAKLLDHHEIFIDGFSEHPNQGASSTPSSECIGYLQDGQQYPRESTEDDSLPRRSQFANGPSFALRTDGELWSKRPWRHDYTPGCEFRRGNAFLLRVALKKPGR